MKNWKQYPALALAGLVALHIIAHIDRNMLMGFSPQIIKDLRLSNTQYGFLSGVVWVLSFGVMAVSYTHLDVYKRQVCAASCGIRTACCGSF